MLGHKYFIWQDNTDWYYIDDDGTPHLTDEAPEEARKSFEAYMELMEKSKETGICY